MVSNNAVSQQILSYLQSAGISSITDLYADTTDIASNRRNSYNIYNDYNSLNTTSNMLCKMTMETYNSTPMDYMYDTQLGDFGLYRNYITDCNMLIYKTIEPKLNNTKRVVIALRGSQTMYDYLVDLDILRDYSSNTEGVENFIHLYSRLLDDVYDKIVEYINEEQDAGNATEFYITGHSLGGKLAMDAFNRLITNDLNAGVYCYIYNPFTVHDLYAEDLLNNIDLAILGNEDHLKYFALKTDIHCQITQGDYISALYLNFYPGNISVYPAISTVQNYLPSLLNVGYNTILSNNNHSLSNFTNKTDADVELTMKAKYYYDALDNVLIPIHLSMARIVNATTKDLSSVAGQLSDNAHLHLKAISDTQQFMNLIDLETDDDHMKYLWEFTHTNNLFRTYFIGSEKCITPIYKITNHEYVNNYHYLYFEEASSTEFNIIRVSSNGHITNTQQCVYTEKVYTAIELSNKRTTGIDLQYKDKAELSTLTQPDAINRRRWTLTFGENSSVIPIQDIAGAWTSPDDLRRLISKDLFTHDSITDSNGITVRFQNMTTGGGGIDVYPVDFYLYDTGNGIFKWGHVNVGDINNYKVVLEHTSDNYYTVKSNSYMQSTSITNAPDSWEILYYDTNRYMIRSTNPMGSVYYLKKPTYNDWQHLQTDTIWMQRQNSSDRFLSLQWDSWDGITGNPADFLFNIEHYSDISLKPVSDSLTTTVVNGSVVDTFMLYPNYLRSPDGDKILTMEYNGNLIIWDQNGAPWHANTYNTGNGMVIQTDGNVVVWGGGTQYDKDIPWLWQAGSQEHPANNIVTGSYVRTVRITNAPAFEVLDINGNVLKTFS